MEINSYDPLVECEILRNNRIHDISDYYNLNCQSEKWEFLDNTFHVNSSVNKSIVCFTMKRRSVVLKKKRSSSTTKTYNMSHCFLASLIKNSCPLVIGFAVIMTEPIIDLSSSIFLFVLKYVRYEFNNPFSKSHVGLSFEILPEVKK